MRSRRKLLQDSKLYLILDREVCSYPKLFEIAKKAISSGVKIIQLRDKFGLAEEILEFSRRIKYAAKDSALFIVNDRIDLAMIAKASGVHLGQDDIPIKLARKIIGSKAIIGISCQTLKQAQEAQRNGADYIGFGSVFKTLTKPERSPMDLALLEKVYKSIKIPVFAIGGMTLKKVPLLKQIGVSRMAICRAILKTSNVQRTTKRFQELLQKTEDN